MDVILPTIVKCVVLQPAWDFKSYGPRHLEAFLESCCIARPDPRYIAEGRSNPRVVKRRIKKFPPKKGGEPMNQRQDWSTFTK